MGTAFSIVREHDDHLAETRMGIGSIRGGKGIYLTFRGDPERVIEVLEETLAKAKEALPKGDYTDERIRPKI